MRVTAVIFDIGDTLINASDLMADALQQTAKYLYFNQHISNIEKFLTAYNHADQRTEGSHINHLFSSPQIIKKTLKLLNLPTSPALIGLFLAIYRENIRKTLKPNHKLTGLFATLKAEGFLYYSGRS